MEQWTGVLYPTVSVSSPPRSPARPAARLAYGFHLGVTNGGTLIVVPSDDTIKLAAPITCM